jgi:uncharacterized protein
MRIERHEIRVGGQELCSIAFSPDEERFGARVPGVLFLHGWGGSLRRDLMRARELARLGFVGLTFNMRGHGETRDQRNSVSRADSLTDALAAYDALRARPNIDRIGVVGSSYGGYIGAILADHRPVRWIALRAPALYKDGGFERPKRELNADPELRLYRRTRIEAEDNLVFRASKRFAGDVLIVESEHDEVIPHAVTDNYLRAYSRARSRTIHRLENADHALSSFTAKVKYVEALAAWFGEKLREDP